MPAPLEIIAYSDFLCPWCYNFTVRMRRLEKEFGNQIQIDWRAYLLRPTPRSGQDPDRFRRYTEGWQRPASEEDAGQFQPWAGTDTPPSHSIPPHIVAKAAEATTLPEAKTLHDNLLKAYFTDSRDISSTAVLRQLWDVSGLPLIRFPDLQDPLAIASVAEEHRESLALGLTGVPAARLAQNPAFVTGALPYAMYQRWVKRHL